jgi:hypothetical protein
MIYTTSSLIIGLLSDVSPGFHVFDLLLVDTYIDLYDS